jgi:glyoxylase-like metal-dependent hydrolase (beta-lactamase superfamily II)
MTARHGCIHAPARLVSKSRLWILLVAAIGLAIAFAMPAAAAQPVGTLTLRTPVWEVYAIRYATIRDFPVRSLVAGADSTRKLDIAMMFWLLEGPNRRRVLVDAGFYRQKFLDSWKPADYARPSDAVERFGIPPDSITDVIISHVHWDHVDGADLFPRARIWIQKEEYEHHVGAGGVPLHPAIDTLDAAMLFQLDRAGRVKMVNGDAQELMPGLKVYTGGKHTYASQYVGVRTAAGTVVVASDNVYLYENLDRHVPIAQTLDAKSNLAAQDRMRRIAAFPRFIVPGHDPDVFKRFHAAGSGVVKVE